MGSHTMFKLFISINFYCFSVSSGSGPGKKAFIPAKNWGMVPAIMESAWILGGWANVSPQAFIVNPHAGNGSTGKQWPVIKARATRRLGKFSSWLTTGVDSARRHTVAAVQQGARRVICVGGDGTLNEVVNGLMAFPPGLRRQMQLGFIPNGTGCDFIRTVPIPEPLDQALKVITAGCIRPVDVGKLVFRTHPGTMGCRYFLNVTSLGLGGEVVERVNRSSKALGPLISFLGATLVSLWCYRQKTVGIETDGRALGEMRILHMAMANGQYQGGGMRIAPGAAVNDGFFNITVVRDLSLAQILRHLPKLYNGNIHSIGRVASWTARRVSIHSRQRVLLDVDGEQPGRLPLEAELLPRAVNLLIPERKTPNGRTTCKISW